VLEQLELADVDDDPGRRAARRTIVVVGASYSGTELVLQLRALADSAAKQLEAPLRAITSTEFGEQIKWSGSNAVIFSNWTVLHGRCAAPEAEGERIVERIYVR